MNFGLNFFFLTSYDFMISGEYDEYLSILIYNIFLSSSFFFDLTASEIIWVFSLTFVSFWVPEIYDFIITEFFFYDLMISEYI